MRQQALTLPRLRPGRLALSAAKQAAMFAEDPARRELMVVTGGRRLMDWLLSAASVEGPPAQPDAVRTLQHLLATRAPRCTRSWCAGESGAC